MPKPFSTWTVLPHGNLTQLDDKMLCVTGTLNMPVGEFERRMTVVLLEGGRLAIFSAIALDEAQMRALERFGRPSYLIVPNDIHRMDAKIWKDRYPTLSVIAPAGAHDKVEEVVHVDQIDADFGDENVHFVVLPGTGENEAAMRVDDEEGTTLILNDVIFNVANRPGFGGWLMKTFGVTGTEPHVPPLVRMRQVKDKEALSAHFEAWSHLPRLKRIIVSHGGIIEKQPSVVLGRVAHELAA